MCVQRDDHAAAEPNALDMERALCEQIAETIYTADGQRYSWSEAPMLAKRRYRKLALPVYRRCFQAQAEARDIIEPIVAKLEAQDCGIDGCMGCSSLRATIARYRAALTGRKQHDQ